MPHTIALALFLLTLVLFPSTLIISFATNSSEANLIHNTPERSGSLCNQLIIPSGYPCSEHSVQTKDGFILNIQRVSSSSSKNFTLRQGPPVLIQHGLILAGDSWFLNPKEESLGYILADSGYDVWVGNVRGTRWSHRHVSLSNTSQAYWNWSWEDLAMYDLAGMLEYIYQATKSKIFFIGHSQGTIMSLAAFTQPDVVKNVKAAALLSPISYLDHVNSSLVRRLVDIYADKMLTTMSLHELNLRSEAGVQLWDYLCRDKYLDCEDILSGLTGPNCCFNHSRWDMYLEFDPHPTSIKNINHLFQMIRQGTFAKYDYGISENMRRYGSYKPPKFDLSLIPKSLPLLMVYGGNDALADLTDVRRTIKELPCITKEAIYLNTYAHADFVVGLKAREDVYIPIIEFFNSQRNSSSS